MSRMIAGFEPLESRRMMDATPLYWVCGTGGNDVITVAQQQSVIGTATTRAMTRSFKGNGALGNANIFDSDNFVITINGRAFTATIPSGTRIHIDGFGGNDYIKVNGSRGADLIGSAGNDTLVGGDGPDILSGGDGIDTADYSARYSNLNITLDDYANDGRANEHDNVYADIEVVYGGLGNDYISTAGVGWGLGRQMNGYLGNDTLVGGDGPDTVWGGAGDDLIMTGKGNDAVRAEGGNDRIYLGEGNDTAYGGAGNDALFGGGGIDKLVGESGSDRFLVQSSAQSFDNVMDLTSDDARIWFYDGPQKTVTFGGQNGSYTFAPGAWTDAEIQNLDVALGALHNATGNSRLLKKANRSELSFTRQGKQISSSGGTFSAAAWNDNGNMYIVETNVDYILHEVGHNWDTEFNSSGWNALSGWTKTNMSNNPNYQKGSGNDGWWYLKSSQFASSYARTNPNEDFAESFAANLVRRAGLFAYQSVVASKNAFIDSMLSTLAGQP